MTAHTEHTVTYKKGLLTIQPARITLREVCIIVGILVFVPVLSSALLPLAQVLAVSVLWSTAIGYLSVGRMRLQSDIAVDIEQKLISLEPLYPALLRRAKTVSFSSIETLTLTPIIVGGRYTPLGRRIKLVLKDKSKITLLDYANYQDAVEIQRIITTIVHSSSVALKNVAFKGKEILVLDVASEQMDYIVYQSVLDDNVYFVNIVKNVGSSLYTVVKALKKSDADKLLAGTKEVRGRIVDSYR